MGAVGFLSRSVYEPVPAQVKWKRLDRRVCRLQDKVRFCAGRGQCCQCIFRRWFRAGDVLVGYARGMVMPKAMPSKTGPTCGESSMIIISVSGDIGTLYPHSHARAIRLVQPRRVAGRTRDLTRQRRRSMFARKLALRYTGAHAPLSQRGRKENQ